MIATIATILVLVAAANSTAAHESALRPPGPIVTRPGSATAPDGGILPRYRSRENEPASPASGYPMLGWPLTHALNDGIVLGLYVDDDTANGSFQDYECSNGTYDGHLGTDFGLYSFRAMDRGEPVTAAAPGTVIWKQDGRADRNTSAPPDDGNYIGIDNGDGSESWYFHLRRNSITVDLGESFGRGTVLGMVGSSGFAFGPHLHFEIGEYAPNWKARDPWAGPCNAVPSLWISQEPYVGDDPLRIHDIGVTTEPAAGGNFDNVPYELLIEGLSQPAITGASEPRIAVWVQFQGNVGDAFRIEIRRPNGTLFTWFDFTLAFKAYFETGVWATAWNGNVTVADHGTWQAQVLVAGNPVRTESFVVGATTQFGPRYSPVAGRSFRITGAVQRDTLRMSALGSNVTYSLLDAPSFVTLVDSVLTIGPTSTQPTRSRYFQAIAKDTAARRDTMWYHVVDPSKPFESSVAVSPPPVRTALEPAWLAPNSPNPFSLRTEIRFFAEGQAPRSLTVHDLSGRRLRTLVDGRSQTGTTTAIWDGLDDRRRPVPSGIYVMRLVVGTKVLSRKMVLAR